jgi:hypothetical protein
MSAIEHDETALVKEVSPAEAAHLIDQLERGYQAAYRAAREAYGTGDCPPRRAMATDLDQLAGDERWATFATGMRQPGESVPQFLDRTQAEAAERQMTCPECGEDAQEQPPADLVNWQAHGLDQSGWSHRDGSALCPVLGPSGGYQPAQPEPAEPKREPEPDVARLNPPATMQAGRDARQAQIRDYLPRGAQAGQRGAIPRQYMAGTIRHLDVTGTGPVIRDEAAPLAASRQAEREAGE